MSGRDLSLILSAMAHLGHVPQPDLLRRISYGKALMAPPAPPSEGGGRPAPSGGGGLTTPSGGGKAAPEQLHDGEGSGGPRSTSHSALEPSAAPATRSAPITTHRALGTTHKELDPRAALGILAQLVRSSTTSSAPPPLGSALDMLLSRLAPSLALMAAGELAALLHALARLQHLPHRRFTARLLQLLRTR